MSHRYLSVFRVLLTSLVFVTGAHAWAEIKTINHPFIADPNNSDRFITARKDYRSFRVPGMVSAPDSSILVFAEGRRGKGGDPRTEKDAPADIVMRRSTDFGRTWLPMVVIAAGHHPAGNRDYGDPNPVVDQVTGRIFVFFGQWADVGPRTPPNGQSTDPANGHHTTWYSTSDDNGKTWSEAKQVVYPDIPTQTPDGLYWRSGEPGPGNGIQLQWQNDPIRNGRLLIPARRNGSASPDNRAHSTPFVYFSDDHGETWQIGNPTKGPNASEDEIVELTNGDILLNARQKDKGTFRRQHLSSDGGVTWGPNLLGDVKQSQVHCSLARYSAVRSGHDRDRLFFSAPIGRKDRLTRENIGVWTSYDEGKTFINPKQFNEEFAAYSVINRLADGSIGLIVETAAEDGKLYGDITFYNFDIQHLEGTSHLADVLHFDDFNNVLEPFSGGIGWSGGWKISGNVQSRQSGPKIHSATFGEVEHHIQIQGGEMIRSLGVNPLDMSSDGDYYLSLFVSSRSKDVEDDEWISVQLRDGSGNQQFAFGVRSNDSFFVRNKDGKSRVTSKPGSVVNKKSYFLLAKIVARTNNADQIYLTWYENIGSIPTDESHVEWRLSGQVVDYEGLSESLFIDGGGNATWEIDTIRIGTSLDVVVPTAVKRL